MKLRIVWLSLLALCLAVVPAVAQTDIYDNGPINGTIGGWNIRYGFVVSDTFTVGAGGAHVNGLEFAVWLSGTEELQSAEVSITSQELGGNTYFDGVVNFTQSGCVANQFGYLVCLETSDPFNGPNLASGTYWLNLQNASGTGDSGFYWDENSGPSQASENSVGTIPSEAFTLLGSIGTTTTGTVPEPSSIILFGSGILGVTAALRRNLF